VLYIVNVSTGNLYQFIFNGLKNGKKNGIRRQNMARVLKSKELVHTRLATNYGGWIYCDKCGENIGYLCYSTYDRLELEYRCSCKSQGKVLLDFVDSRVGCDSCNELVTVKNRLCCPEDMEPLITILEKKVVRYEVKITCKSCGNIYTKNYN